MRPLDRKQKVLRFIALAALGLLLAPFVAVQVQERIFRHRAERLLADMRSLMLRKATMAEIEAVFKRWNPHGDPCFGELGYFYGHPRSGQGCNLAADSWSPSFDKNPEGAENYWSGLWRLLFVIGGGRDAHIRAYAIVEGGDVKSLWFRVDVDLSLAHIDGYRLPATLSGSVVTIPRFSVSDVWLGLTLHPNYLMVQSPPVGERSRNAEVNAEFGPHANPADIARLTSFDLSCLTRLMTCRKPEDIMPEAAAQFAKEEPQLAQVRKDHVCGPDIVGLMARDADYAGVVEMTGSGTEHTGDRDDVPVPTVRLIQDFKPATRVFVGAVREPPLLPVQKSLIPRVAPTLPIMSRGPLRSQDRVRTCGR